jgi:hypothetical protein
VGWGDEAFPQAPMPVWAPRSPPFGREARWERPLDLAPGRLRTAYTAARVRRWQAGGLAPLRRSVPRPFGYLNVDRKGLPAPQHLERDGVSRAGARDPLRQTIHTLRWFAIQCQ